MNAHPPPENLTRDEVMLAIREIWPSTAYKRMRIIVQRYISSMGLNRHFDPDDVLQEVAMKLLDIKKHPWPRRLAVRKDYFLLLCARQLCVDKARLGKLNGSLERAIRRTADSGMRMSGGASSEHRLQPILSAAEISGDPLAIIEGSEWYAKLMKALEGKNTAQAILWMGDVCGSTLPDISEELGLEKRTIESANRALNRAKANLAEEAGRK